MLFRNENALNDFRYFSIGFYLNYLYLFWAQIVLFRTSFAPSLFSPQTRTTFKLQKNWSGLVLIAARTNVLERLQKQYWARFSTKVPKVLFTLKFYRVSFHANFVMHKQI